MVCSGYAVVAMVVGKAKPVPAFAGLDSAASCGCGHSLICVNVRDTWSFASSAIECNFLIFQGYTLISFHQGEGTLSDFLYRKFKHCVGMN